MAVTSDYTGRTVDLFIAQGAQTSGNRLISLALNGDNGGKITTGIQKAAQTFMLLLLTNKGSRPHDTNFGTRFIGTLLTSNADDSQLQLAFKDAVEDILDQQSVYLDPDASDDEVISNIELLSIATPSPDVINLTVQLITATGESRDIVVPVTLAIK